MIVNASEAISDENDIDEQEDETLQKKMNPRDTISRNADVVRYMPLIHKVISRMAYRLPYMMEEEDMVAIGVLGLIDALERYQPGALAFHHYAEIRIRGAILDELRRLDLFSRGLRRKARSYREAIIRSKNRLGRMPTIEEIAEAMGMEPSEVEELREQVQPVVFTDLEKLDFGNQPQTGEGIFGGNKKNFDPFLNAQKKQIRQKVKEALERLAERQRLILSLYYFEEMTLREIGELLGLSESRICQIHRKACTELKQFIDVDTEDFWESS